MRTAIRLAVTGFALAGLLASPAALAQANAGAAAIESRFK